MHGAREAFVIILNGSALLKTKDNEREATISQIVKNKIKVYDIKINATEKDLLHFSSPALKFYKIVTEVLVEKYTKQRYCQGSHPPLLDGVAGLLRWT